MASAQKTTKRAMKNRVIQIVTGYAFALPVILGMLIFTLFPTVYALISSFFDVQMGEFVFRNFGFQNYLAPFREGFDSYLFGKSMEVTFLFAVINIPLTLALSFSLALFLNQKVKGMNGFRVLYYLPVLIPAVCNGLLWKNIMSVDYGVANALLQAIGLPKSYWLNDSSTSMASLIFIGMFGLGGSMILWLAQLKNIPETLYESAKLDGAGYFRRLFSITIPMCTPMIFYNLVLSVISTLQTFTTVQTLTDGSGPVYSLHFYIINVYGVAYGEGRLGYASALSFILMIIIGLLTLIVFKTGGWVHYGEDE